MLFGLTLPVGGLAAGGTLYWVTGSLVIRGGWSFGSCRTVMAYDCVAVPPRPSATVSVTFAVPSWLTAGVQLTNPVVPATDMPLGPLVREKVSGSLSGSVA